MKRSRRFILGALAALGVGCGEPEPVARVQLRVPLYSYIPDAAGDSFQSLSTRIEQEFEREHPEVDLVVNPSCFKDDLYDPSALALSLRGEGECPYEVVEVDTLLLGELADTGALRAWPRLPQDVAWHPASVTASTWQGTLYGIPHWMCSHYILTRDAEAAQADTVSELLRALAARQTPEPDVTGNLYGSWNLPAIYLDAWADTHGAQEVAGALTADQYDAATLQSLRAFSRACQTPSGNPCLDGTYDTLEDFDTPARLFAQGKADALFGYSERLHTVLRNLPPSENRGALKLSIATLGEGDRPLLFTDSFVLSARCTGRCEQAALAFTEYMSRASTFAWLLMSEDAPAQTRVPRYLMAASLEAYDVPALREDPYFPVIAAESRDGTPFPNGGMLGLRWKMHEDLQRALTAPGP
jgi:thiamine pyridinylase